MQNYYKKFIFEAEKFHVTKFIRSEKIDRQYLKALDIILNKGSVRGVIAFHSKYGQGKTFFFEVLHGMIFKSYNVNIFKKTSAKELVEIYKSKGEKGLLDFINVRNLFIDDIGDELSGLSGGVSKNFGNSMNVLRYVILKRYEMWQTKGWKLHGTTNIDLQNLGVNYGGRVADRLVQMIEILEFNFTETSFRQVKSIRPLIESEKQANFEKYYPKKEEGIERVDMIKFLNNLIKEDSEQLMNYDIYFWTFIKEYLERNKLINYTEITNKHLETAELLARQSIRKETVYKNLHESAGNQAKHEKYNGLDYKSLMKVAKNAQVRSLILNLKSNNKTF